MLAGLVRPDNGAIRWADRPPDRSRATRLGVVFHRPVLLNRSALANVRFALAAAGVPARQRRERAMEALVSGGLDALARVPARVLSGGEQQRLALARAMAIRPDALFLDEATANLDPHSTLAIENQVRKARELGTPVLLVTHDLAQARRLGERILYLNDGILEADSRAPDFFTAPTDTACPRLRRGPPDPLNRRHAVMTGRILCALMLVCAVSGADERAVVVQSTTSTQNSGLFDEILPHFTETTGIFVKVVAVGTGQALRNSMNGDGDVLLVHARDAEETFVAEGYGVERFNLMYNDFVIVGPAGDPAGLAGLRDAGEALMKIAGTAATFASRGDDSGTHQKEMTLWRTAGFDPTGHSGSWYLETGSGMGATLNVAANTGAYALTDRATWIAFQNKGDLVLHVEGDENLFNQYGVTIVNPERFPHVHAEDARIFVDWLLSEAGQTAIASYRIDGRQLFFPNASPP